MESLLALLFVFNAFIHAAASEDHGKEPPNPLPTSPPMLAIAPLGLAAMPLPRFHRRQVASCSSGFQLCGDGDNCCATDEVCWEARQCASDEASCPTEFPVPCSLKVSGTSTFQCCDPGRTCSFSFDDSASTTQVFCAQVTQTQKITIDNLVTEKHTVTVSEDGEPSVVVSIKTIKSVEVQIVSEDAKPQDPVTVAAPPVTVTLVQTATQRVAPPPPDDNKGEDGNSNNSDNNTNDNNSNDNNNSEDNVGGGGGNSLPPVPANPSNTTPSGSDSIGGDNNPNNTQVPTEATDPYSPTMTGTTDTAADAAGASPTGTPTKKKSNSNIGIIVGVAVGITAILCGVIAGIWFFISKKNSKNDDTVMSAAENKPGFGMQQAEIYAPVPPAAPASPRRWGTASEHFPPNGRGRGGAAPYMYNNGAPMIGRGNPVVYNNPQIYNDPHMQYEQQGRMGSGSWSPTGYVSSSNPSTAQAPSPHINSAQMHPQQMSHHEMMSGQEPRWELQGGR